MQVRLFIGRPINVGSAFGLLEFSPLQFPVSRNILKLDIGKITAALDYI